MHIELLPVRLRCGHLDVLLRCDHLRLRVRFDHGHPIHRLCRRGEDDLGAVAPLGRSNLFGQHCDHRRHSRLLLRFYPAELAKPTSRPVGDATDQEPVSGVAAGAVIAVTRTVCAVKVDALDLVVGNLSAGLATTSHAGLR